jgi:hypothetical protein
VNPPRDAFLLHAEHQTAARDMIKLEAQAFILNYFGEPETKTWSAAEISMFFSSVLILKERS